MTGGSLRGFYEDAPVPAAASILLVRAVRT